MKIEMILSVLLTMCACTVPSDDETGSKLAAPTSLSAEQTGSESVVLTWTDNAQGETGYRMFLRGENDAYMVAPLETIEADSQSYTYTGLTPGAVYDLGVQALSSDIKCHSEIVYLLKVHVVDPNAGKEDDGNFGEGDKEEEIPQVPQVDPKKVPQVVEVKSTYAYIAVTYMVETLNGSNPEHGVCFSENGVPSVADIKAVGPQISTGKSILQVVPNAYLADGKEYQMSVYVKDGDKYTYSKPQTVKLAAQPEDISLSWEKQPYASAGSVEIYKTTSKLNGRNFNAWYAVADPSQVEFKVLNTPTGKANLKTVAYQAENAAGDCLVLINGGVFGNYHIGVIHVDGQPQEWVDFVYDKYWNPNSDRTSWYITRPIVGVDKSGKAAACWTASPSVGTYYHYDRPLPTVPGEAAYSAATATYPVTSVSWTPYNALSTGPMLLYDGKCCINHEKAPSGAYMTNYECWALDIYEGNPDRTAVGVTADGKIVLFICDGRITQSDGATHEEVAMIMKSIGCVHAMNLDGGGSTGMWVKGAGMINYKDSSWRAVKSTLGFFAK